MGYKIAGINDDVDHCSRCGKQGLKRVAWVYDEEQGPTTADPVGLDCLAVLLGYGKREKGRVPPKAIRRAILDWYVEQWRTFLSTPVVAEVRLTPGICLRVGQFDYQIRINDTTQKSPAEQGLQSAINYTLQEFTRARMDALGRTWREETTLASNPNRQEEWPKGLLNRRPAIEKTVMA